MVKKASALLTAGNGKLVELGYGNCHRKTLSNLVSPTNSVRSSNPNLCHDSDTKRGKGHFNFELYASLKENTQVLSPKGAFDFK